MRFIARREVHRPRRLAIIVARKIAGVIRMTLQTALPMLFQGVLESSIPLAEKSLTDIVRVFTG